MMDSSSMGGPPPDPMTARLMAEKSRLDPSLSQIHQIVDEEIAKRSGLREPEYIEVDVAKQMKLIKKVLVPFHRNPGFNYIGKLMGPGGATLKKIQEKNSVKMHVCGRGSSKDRSKEEELLLTGDPKYSHFGENLHVKIEVFAAPVEAFRRMANALEDVKAHFNPDLNDEISKSQIEQGFVPSKNNQSGGSGSSDRGRGRGGRGGGGDGGDSIRGRGNFPNQRGRGGSGMPPGRGMPAGRGMNSGPVMGYQRPPAPQAPPDYNGLGGGDYNGSSASGYYDNLNSSYGDAYGQQNAASNVLPPSMPLRHPGPRPVYNQPPGIRHSGNQMQPSRAVAPMGMNHPRSSAGGGPRMMMNQNGGMQMGGGGKMPPGGGQMRDYRMHPYGGAPSGPRNNGPPNPYA